MGGKGKKKKAHTVIPSIVPLEMKHPRALVLFCLQGKVIQGEILSPKVPLKEGTSSDRFSKWTRSPRVS